MNVFVSIIFLALSTILGVIFSLNFSKKSNFFSSFLLFHKKYINELNFSQRSLISLIKELDNENDFNNMLSDYINKQEFNCQIKYLNDEEASLLKSYFSNLGLFDKTTLLNLYNGYTLKIEKMYENAIADEKKYKSLYVKVGFLIGLIGFVVFI